MMPPKKWEIWLAKVKFEDDLSIVKDRPVLVIDKNTFLFISLKITSHAPRTNCDGEYEIIYWQQAGLRKQSTIRVSKHLDLIESDFIHKIGRLHPQDVLNVQTILEK